MAEETPKDQNTETPKEPKLIAGKYKTVEDAEAALREKDNLIARQGQELGTLRKQTQTRSTTPQAEPVDEDADNERLAQALLTNPKRVFTGIVNSVVSQMRDYTDLAIASTHTMDRFLRNHDLATKHDKLFKSLLLETDIEKTLEERLEDAHTALKGVIERASSEGKKTADAERKAKDRVLNTVVSDDVVQEKKVDPDDEKVDTPQSYMEERKAQLNRIRAAV